VSDGPGCRPMVRIDKYRVVASLLNDASGTMLDVGARDRRLHTLLNSDIAYASADLGAGHDYILDLERRLPLPDGRFDFVVALDVLEHLEAIHQAFDELARITNRTLFIALPNMATARRRVSYLIHGHLGTGKYDLGLEHQGDRHRWLTVYEQMNAFIQERATQAGLNLRLAVDEVDCGTGSVLYRGLMSIGEVLVKAGAVPRSLIVDRCIYVLDRRDRHES
jgi:hypothetical protein